MQKTDVFRKKGDPKMKKIIALICVLFLLSGLVGCATEKNVDGKYCGTYGLFNVENKCEGVPYRTVVGNIFWGIVLVETIVAPIYFFGFSLYEPAIGEAI